MEPVLVSPTSPIRGFFPADLAPQPRADTRVDALPHPLLPPVAPCLVTDFVSFQATAHPREPAVQFEDDEPTSYGRLRALTAHIATRLPTRTRSIVPVCMDVSVEFIATILAVLGSGAAYTILDPAGSAARNRDIVADCAADFVVADRRHAAAFERATLIEDIVSDFAPIDPPDDNHPDRVRIGLHDPAYLIYTSGSTGKPKGVVLSHENVSTGIDHFSLNGRKRWLLFYNPVFSAAQRTILATLSKGACLCLASRERMATSLTDILQAMEIDALGITPSALSLMKPEDAPRCLKQVTTVGEPLSQSTVDLWAETVQLRASYGLSECAQLNFSRQLQPGDSPRVVGRPTDSTTAVILEPDTRNRIRDGTPGELCLSGPQIAQGYHNRPTGTSARFVWNPDGRGTMYRTGDLAVKHADGQFEILGRIDYQLKINGQRLEPEEVAAVISQHEHVRSAAVVGALVNSRLALAAVVIPEPGHDWSPLVRSLKRHTDAALPRYMAPNYWIQLDTFPVNAHGKTDVRALRELVENTSHDDLLRSQSDGPGVDFDTDDLARQVRDAWTDALNLTSSAIRGTESFTSLGGSSMEAIQVVRRLRAEGILLELGDMLGSQSLVDVKDAAVPSTKTPTDPLPDSFSLVDAPTEREQFIADRGITDTFRPTALQEALLSSTIQGNKHYLYRRMWDVRHLDHVRLQLAFQMAFSRNEMLRSTFVTTESGMYQLMRNDLTLPWDALRMDLTSFMDADMARGIELGQPLVRATLLNETVLVVSMHHSLFDYWSNHFIYEDVAQLYHGSSPEPRPSWTSYQAHLQGLDQHAMHQSWHEYMSEAKSTVLNYAPTETSSQVTRHLDMDLKAAAASLHVTSSAIVYSAWAIVLSQHLNSTDVAFATSFSGREQPVVGIERLDGPTLTVVPQRVVFEPQHTLDEIVRRVNSRVWEVLKHSQYGMRKALAAGGHRTESLVDTMVNILAKDDRPHPTTNEVFQPYGARPNWQTEYTTLEVEESSDGLRLSLSTSIDPKRAGFILDAVMNTIVAISTEPKSSSFELLDTMGRAEFDWLNQPTSSPDQDSTLLSGFEDSVVKHASRVAVQWQQLEIITYHELNLRANRMANYLLTAGVREGDIVPLLLEKSPTMIISILALFKLGAAYVPLSHENPLERNLFIVREVKATRVLTETDHARFFPPDELHSILLDDVPWTAFSPVFDTVHLTPDHRAYLLYTSGSTGQPKGVTITHGACSAAMRSIIDFEGKQDARFRALQFSNYVFDVSLYDMFVTLHAGGTLCLAPTSRLMEDLSAVINDMDVDHAFLTPTVTRLLNPKDVPGMKSMTVGGEQVTQDVVDTWASEVDLANGYGPTECSVLVTMKKLGSSTLPRNIGGPLQSADAFILQTNGNRLAPYGAIGELCFSGSQLSEGYFRRPDLTEAAFCTPDIPDVDTIYRTGDLARWLPNHDIECLGRKDDQVKVNGHRIELGEIEQALMRTEQLKECAVLAIDYNGKQPLTAFVVVEPGTADGPLRADDFTDELLAMKRDLRGLTPYMIPKFVVPLAFLPKLPSGKTDKKRLKALVAPLATTEISAYSFDSIGSSSESQLIPVETEAQGVLQKAWAAVLGADEDSFGLEGHFLNMGGDSIAAINLSSYLRKRGCTIAVSDIFKSPNLADMATCLKADEEDAQPLAPVEFDVPEEVHRDIQQANLGDGVDDIYPSPPGQSEFLTQGARAEQFWCLMTIRRMPESTDTAEWVRLVQKLTEVNEILRTTFTKHDGKWYNVVLKESTPVVQRHKITDENPDRQRQEIISSLWTHRFVFGAPYIQYAILEYPDKATEIVTKMDHGLYDGTLLRIFDAHFKGFQEPQRAPEPFTPFRDFADATRAALTDRTREFWTSPANRPTSFTYPALPSPQVSSSIVVNLPLAFDGLANATGATVSTILQAVYQLYLARRSAAPDVAFDYLYTGRNVDIPNPQSINGTCANFLPLRSAVDRRATVADYLRGTQDAFWAATEHGVGVGLEDVYAMNGTTRDAVGNTGLFLFQPFEPPPPQQEERQRWVVMAKSEVTMPLPYAQVFEVIKTADGGHKIKFQFDERLYDQTGARHEVDTVVQMLERMVKPGGKDMPLSSVLDE